MVVVDLPLEEVVPDTASMDTRLENCARQWRRSEWNDRRRHEGGLERTGEEVPSTPVRQGSQHEKYSCYEKDTSRATSGGQLDMTI